MSRMAAAPCAICGKELENVDEDSTNQPHKASMFSGGGDFATHGHYGDTMFDPMNGEYLIVHICEECLPKLAAQGRVLIARNVKPVLAEGVMVGWTAARRMPVPWRPDMPESEDDLRVDSAEEWAVVRDQVDLTGGGRAHMEHVGWEPPGLRRVK